MLNRKGLLGSKGMTAAHFANLHGQASHLYNYNVRPFSQAELDFVNANNIEFVPMFGGAYAQTQSEDLITGWPLAQGSNERCYLWSAYLPTSPSNEYYGSSLCTASQLIELVNATASVVNQPLKRIALFNEPWPDAAYPEDPSETATFYKNLIEPIAYALGLSVVTATSQQNDRALNWDTAFFQACEDLQCDFSLISQWSIHEYKVKQSYIAEHYTFPTGSFYTDREAAFASGYGRYTGAQWQQMFRSWHLWFTEHSAEQETGTSFGAPDNTGTCLRLTGQFGAPGNCLQFGSAACNWGAGSLAWMLDTANLNVVGVIIWPTYYAPDGGNQHGGRSSRLVYEDGSLTPNGRAFLAMPEHGMDVECEEGSVKSPSPPPPLPPSLPLPPLQPFTQPPAAPPPPAPLPPLVPLDCSAMYDRTNTQTLGANGKFCYQMSLNQGCEKYYSLTSNGNTRICYNPVHPHISNDLYCAQTDAISCPFEPPRPPPPPPRSP